MSSANQTQKVRFVVPTLVGSTRYLPGVHELDAVTAQALVAAGDAQPTDADQGGGNSPQPTDAQLAAAEAAENQRLADEALAQAAAEAQAKADAEAAAKAEAAEESAKALRLAQALEQAEAEAKAKADAEAAAKAQAPAAANTKKAGGKR